MTSNTDRDTSLWPDIDVSRWAPTKRSLHLYSQMLGKMRVALSPPQPNWMHTALHLRAHGFATGTMPYEGTAVEAILDVFRSEILVRRSTGDERRIALLPAKTVADIYTRLGVALSALGVRCPISNIPQEIPDTTPFDEDHREAAYDPLAVQRWFRAVTSTAQVFEEWRSPFFGRTGIQLWWGAFDLSLMLFTGKQVPAPVDRGYLLKYDLDAELMNAGLYLGDATTPAFFYGYIYPQPQACENLPISPPPASWSSTYKEWVLPYDAARSSEKPDELLRRFLDSIYNTCVTASGWEREKFTYAAPTIHAKSRGT